MAEVLSNEQVLRDLAPTAEDLFNRHMATTRDWYPEELIDFGAAKNVYPPNHPKHVPFNPEATGLSDGTRSALFVNLLTEDNLPYYFRTIERQLGPNGVWGEWGRRWTAEEGRHSIAIRGIILAKGLLEHRAVEDGRMAQVSGGETPEPDSVADILIYTDLQELATQISHRNTGKHASREDPGHKDVHALLARVAGDETRHNIFYHSLVVKGFEVDPSGFMIAAYRQVRDFTMPGTGIPEFTRHKAEIARAGIYNGDIHLTEILEPTIDKWDIENLSNLSPEAEQARVDLLAYVAKLKRVLDRRKDRETATKASE